MKILLTIFLLSCVLLTRAQKVDVIVSYYDKKDQPLTEKSGSYYYRIDSTAEGKYGAYSYYTSNDQLRHREAFLESEKPRYEVWYYENSQKMWEGMCRFNDAVGKIDMWYDDGKKLAVLEFPEERGEMREYQIMQYWDSQGTQLVVNGAGSANFKFPYVIENGNGSVVDGRKHGVWTGKVGDGIYEERYDNGKLVDGTTTKDDKTYNYTEIEEQAVPQDGMESFYRFVSKNMVYPMKARRSRVDGKVLVEFVVYNDGVVGDVKVIKGISKECDAEAARVIGISPKWAPGRQRGLPVKTRMVLPLTFRLRR